jgi:cell shape-determining protein MreC
VSAGEKNGVMPGDLALVSDQTAVGAVSQVDNETSLVTLFSAPGSAHEVLVGEGASTTPVQLKGRGSGNFEAEVLRDASISVGDVAALHSGYVIALVGRVDRAPEDPSQHVLLRVPINLETLRFVDIVRVPFVEAALSAGVSEAE